MNASKKELLGNVLETALSWLVALAMFIYGIAKPLQFSNMEPKQKIIAELSGMELMWSFYGYSISYPIFIGILEVGGACLLLFRRTRLLACLLLSSILLNIILQDIIYEVKRGALRAAIFYQLSLLIIAYRYKGQLIEVFMKLTQKPDSKFVFSKKIKMLGLAFLLLIVLRLVEFFISNYKG